MTKRPGFTLLELLTVMGVAAILVVIGFPSLQAMKQNAAVSGGAQELASILRQAQGQALAGSGNSSQRVSGGGSTYTHGVAIYSLPAGVSVTAFDVTFLRRYGTTSPFTIDITGSSLTKHISISATGVVTLQ